MLPSPAASPMGLQEEGARCKASLRAFTQRVVDRLGVSELEADRLRKCDASINDGNVYLYFPFCFSEAFATVALEDLRILGFSGILWMSYMRAQDNTIDDAGSVDLHRLFLRDLYLRESLHLLYRLFPYDSRFWHFYSTYYDEYARAVLFEVADHSSIESTYDTVDFHRIAKGKAAMAKYPVAAQAVLSGRDDKMPMITESLDCFHVGYQYWDDLVDWKQDLANSKFSLLLANALKQVPPETRTLPLDQLRLKIARVVYHSGLAEEQLDHSFTWLERAYELAVEAGCTTWATHVRALQKQTVVLKTDLRSLMSKQQASR